MGRITSWIHACRPPTLAAAVAPVAVGSAVAFAEGAMRVGPALAALGGAIAIQIGTNLANDAYDAEKGADTSARLGPPRAVSSGLLEARAVKRAMVLAFVIASLFGLYLVREAGPAVVAIGLVSIAAGVAYTAGPWALAYLGLGDVFVIAFFGFVAVCGTAFVEAGFVPELAVWAAIPVGALATGILIVNNVRDRETDLLAKKHTLVVRFGRRFGVIEHAVLLGVSYTVPVVIGGFAMLPLLTLPLAVVVHRELRRRDGRALNATLKKSGALLIAFALLFAAGIAGGSR
jgi:1,4-dihydroxy-2-naphthoate polyprenyltransferase